MAWTYVAQDETKRNKYIIGTTLNNSVLHAVCAIGDGYVWMITAYFPSIEEWMPDYRTRREKR